ncbi:MAG: class I SAM-dependent methyltransferase [Paracoccaceae bacterium]
MLQKTTDSASADAGNAYFTQGLPRLPFGFPNGWMSAKDLTVLHNAALRTVGPVLEVGPWLGRSSSAIASGLRIRAETDGQMPVFYDMIDFGITSASEWTERFNEKFRMEKDQGRVAEAVYHPGGTIAVLIKNLKDNELLKYVTNLIRGDFLDCPIERSYGLIFCDATHDDAEIHRHLPKLARLAGPGSTLIFDDIITEERADLVRSYLDVKFSFMTRSRFPNRSDRCKLLVVETN